MKPLIITKKFLFVGFEAEIDVKETHWHGMDDVKSSLKDNLGKIANRVEPTRFTGIWGADPGADYSKPENRSKRLYFYGVEVSSIENIPPNCIVKDFPESAYAVFKESEHGSPKYQWLQSAGFEPDREFQSKYALDMEVFNDIDNDGDEWDVLIPIKMK